MSAALSNGLFQALCRFEMASQRNDRAQADLAERERAGGATPALISAADSAKAHLALCSLLLRAEFSGTVDRANQPPGASSVSAAVAAFVEGSR